MSPAIRCEAVSFDLFNAVVDLRAGLAAGLARHAGLSSAPQAARLAYEREAVEEELLDKLEEFVPYDRLFASSLLEAASRAGAPLAPEQAAAIVADAGSWPHFPDAAPALQRIAAEKRVGVLSNFPRPLAAPHVARLGLAKARLIVADDVEAYLPEPDLLLALTHELELDEDQLLHVSCDPERDLYTAEDLGVRGVFVDRRGEGAPEDLGVAFVARDWTGVAARLLAPRRPPFAGRPGVARRPSRR